MKVQYKDYDVLRVLATFFVVVGHSNYLNITTTHGGVNYLLPEMLSATYNESKIIHLINFTMSWVYGFHMPLFFMLSGAVYGIKKANILDELCMKKFKRLVIPFFVYGAFFMLPVKYLGGFYSTDSIKMAYLSLLDGKESGHLWFLLSLFWVFILFWFIEKISKGSITVVLILSIIIHTFRGKIDFDFLKLQSGMGYIHWFAIGYVFHAIRENMESFFASKKKIICFTIVLLLVSIFEYKYLSAHSVFRILSRSTLVYMISLMFQMCIPKLTECKFFKVLLRNSFYIYIFHDPLEYIILRFSFHFNWLTSSVGCYLYFFLRIVGVIIVSIVFGECIQFLKRRYKG